MQRLATGLGIAAALLGVFAMWLYVQNGRLQGEIIEMEGDLSRMERQLEASQEATRKAIASARSSKSPRLTARPNRRPTRRPEGAPVAPGERPAVDPERVDQVRQTIRGRAMDRMFRVAEEAGAAQGWDGATIAEVQAILEDAFLTTGEIRELARDGQMEPEAARADVERVRADREAALVALLGSEDARLLEERMRTPSR